MSKVFESFTDCWRNAREKNGTERLTEWELERLVNIELLLFSIQA